MKYQHIIILLTNIGYGLSFHITPIRSIIASQAFASSLLKNINQEFISDNTLFKDLLQYHSHINTDIAYTLLFAITLYTQYTFHIDNTGWEDIELFKNKRRKFNMILTILFVILVRNVDNAI
jgi:hypothetical protein